jgi:hypothetical protein
MSPKQQLLCFPAVRDRVGSPIDPAGAAGERRRGAMPMFMDHHKGVEGLTAQAVADAHKKDLEIQGEYGVKYHRYWFNEETGDVFCLAEAPNK